MSTITVTTQTELDAALKKHGKDPYAEIVINSPSGVWLEVSSSGSATVSASGSATVSASGSATVSASGSATVSASGSATVSASGSATVRASGSATVRASDSATVRAYDSATVRAYGSATVRAYGSATVRASGSATVRAYDSATVRASDSATVRASDSATVRAYGSATVRAYGSATVSASNYVAIHLHSAAVTHEGGVIIDVTAVDRSDTATWAGYHGAQIEDDELIVYKAVDAHLQSGRGFAYPIGETVEDPAWKPGDFCGSGLHFSPHPHQALAYFSGATRFLECAVKLSELSIIDGNSGDTPKLKAKRARVIREVDLDGAAL